MIGYMLAPLAIGLIGSVIGVLLGVFLGIRAMLDVYENIIGLPILNESIDWSMVPKNSSAISEVQWYLT